MTSLGWDITFFRADLPQNKPEAVSKEILDPQLIRRVAESRGLSAKQLAGIKIAEDPDHGWINIYQIGKDGEAFTVLSADLRAYSKGRAEGHTQAFLMMAITNASSLSTIRDSDLRILATNHGLMAVSWATKTGFGIRTNIAGIETDRRETTTTVNDKRVTTVTVHVPKTNELCRWVSHRIIDGEIAWDYHMQFKADGSLNYSSSSKSDARDYDERYRQIIEDVTSEVTAQMKKDGSYGQFGSINYFWHLKKERLKAKGIDWRSPTELNPGACYD
jgi:hypothetical protein